MSFENRILELRTRANLWNILDYNYGKWKICTCCDTTITMILIFKMFINYIDIGIFCIAQLQMAFFEVVKETHFKLRYDCFTFTLVPNMIYIPTYSICWLNHNLKY